MWTCPPRPSPASLAQTQPPRHQLHLFDLPDLGALRNRRYGRYRSRELCLVYINALIAGQPDAVVAWQNEKEQLPLNDGLLWLDIAGAASRLATTRWKIMVRARAEEQRFKEGGNGIPAVGPREVFSITNITGGHIGGHHFKLKKLLSLKQYDSLSLRFL